MVVQTHSEWLRSSATLPFLSASQALIHTSGAISEVLGQGVTGFIVPGRQEAIQAVENIEIIDRATCRKVFETRFTLEIMA